MHFLLRNWTNISTNSKFLPILFMVSFFVDGVLEKFFEKNSYSTKSPLFVKFSVQMAKKHFFGEENLIILKLRLLTKFTWLRLASSSAEGMGGLGGWNMGGVVALGGMLGIAAATGGPMADIVIQVPCGVFDTFILPVKLIQLCYETILSPIKKSADTLRTRSILFWSPDCTGQLDMYQNWQCQALVEFWNFVKFS